MKILVPLLLASAGIALAQTGVIDRYESVLVRNPSQGAAFDKVYLHHLEAGGLDALREKWSMASESDGDDASAYLLLIGLLDARMGRTDAANAAFDRYVARHPDDAAGWLALARVAKERNRLKDASGALERALERMVDAEERIAVSRELAMLLDRQFRSDEALVVWRRIAAEHPNDSAVLEEVADALAAAGEFGEARGVLEGISTQGDAFQRVKLAMRLAVLDEREGRAAEALRQYDTLLEETSGTSWQHREARGRIEALYRRADDLPGLAGYYENRLERHPRDVEAALRLSDVYSELGRTEEAAEWVGKSAEWAPDRRDVQLAAARHLLSTDRQAAIRILEQMLRNEPGDAEAMLLVGKAHWDNGDGDVAAALEAWKRLAPPGAGVGAVMRLAEVLEQHGMEDAAAVEYRRVLEIDPTAADARAPLALLLAKMGQTEEAWRVMDAIVPESGATAADYLRLARLQRQAARKEEALATVRKGLEVEPVADLMELEYRICLENDDREGALAVVDRLLAGEMTAERRGTIEEYKAGLLRELGRRDQVIAAAERREAAREPLAEEDYRLWIRLLMLPGISGDLMAVLDRARQRYPDSLPLLELDAQAAAAAGNARRREVALRALAERDAPRRGMWLRELATLFEREQKIDSALSVAEEAVAASPADPAPRLLAAGIADRAGRTAETEKWLLESIPLSESGRQARMQLATLYLENGRHQDAIDALERTLEEEESPQGKLTIVQSLAEAYLRAGRIAELIDRYKRRQLGEAEGGARYALYLSEIHLRLYDFASARDELERALAANPRDAALLRQLLQMAAREGNAEQEIRYLRLLADVEPTPANELALALPLFGDEKTEEAWSLIDRHSSVWLAQPSLLLPLTPELVKAGMSERVHAVLDREIAKDPRNWGLRLRKFELRVCEKNDAAAAEEALRLYEDALEDSATSEMPQNSPLRRGWLASASDEELARSYEMRCQRLGYCRYLTGHLLRVLKEGNSQSLSRSSSSHLDGFAVRDAALALYFHSRTAAVGEERAAADVDALLERTGAGAADRMIAVAALTGPEYRPAEDGELAAVELAAIRRQVEEPADDARLDAFCLARLAVSGPKTDDVRRQMGVLTERWRADAGPSSRAQAGYAMALRELGRQEEADGAFAAWIDGVEPTDLMAFSHAYRIVLSEADPALMDALLQKRAGEIARGSGRRVAVLPGGYLLDTAIRELRGNRGGRKKADPEKALLVFERVLEAVSAEPRLQSGVRMVGGGYYGRESTLYPTTFLDDGMLVESFATGLDGLRSANMLPAFREMLARRERESPEGGRDFFAFLGAATDWELGRQKEAMDAMQRLLEKSPENGLRIVLGRMRIGSGDGAGAMEMLDAVREGPDRAFVAARTDFLRACQLEGEMDRAREAARRLVAMPLNRYERERLASVMRNIGLAEESAALSVKQARQATTPYDLASALDDLVEAGRRDAALAVAEQLLGMDLMRDFSRGKDAPVRRACRALLEFGLLEERVRQWERQMEATPGSQRLRFLLAAGHGELPGGGAAATAHWAALASLRPDDVNCTVAHADALGAAERWEEAVSLYDAVMERKPELLITYDCASMLAAYRRSGELPRLIETVLRLPVGGPDNPNWRQAEFLEALADILRDDEMLEDSIRVLRRAVETSGGGTRYVADLVHTLSEAGVRNEATQALKEMLGLAGEGRPRDAAGRLVLRNEHNDGYNYGPGWLWASGMRLIALAYELDAVDEIATAMAEERDAAGTDYTRLAFQIAARRTGALAEVKKAIAGVPKCANSNEDKTGALLCIGQLLEWPRGRPLAMEWMKAIVTDGRPFGDRSMDLSGIDGTWLRVAEDLGEEKMVEAALKAAPALLRKDLSLGRWWDSAMKEAAAVAIEAALRREMWEVAAEVLDAMPPDSGGDDLRWNDVRSALVERMAALKDGTIQPESLWVREILEGEPDPRGPNRLVNPNLEGLPADAGIAAPKIAGWNIERGGMWLTGRDRAPDGSVPKIWHLPARRDDWRPRGRMTAARVEAAGGSALVLEGWFRTQSLRKGVALTMRILDEKGREIGRERVESEAFPGWQRLRIRTGPDAAAIPEGTAFIEPEIEIRDRVEMAGLFLGEQ